MQKKYLQVTVNQNIADKNKEIEVKHKTQVK